MKINKKESQKNFNGSNELFESCWRKYLLCLTGGLEDPTCQEDIDAWLKTIASEKVNNPYSKFYMHG